MVHPLSTSTTISAVDVISTLECWQLSASFVKPSQAYTAGAVIAQLGETRPTSYTILVPLFDEGFHNAPAVPVLLLFRVMILRTTLFLFPTKPTPIDLRCRKFPPRLRSKSHHTWWLQWIDSSRGHEECQLTRPQDCISEQGRDCGHTITYLRQRNPAHRVLHAGPCKKGVMDQ